MTARPPLLQRILALIALAALIALMLFGGDGTKPASGTDARSGETHQGLDPKGDGPVRDSADANNFHGESIS